MGNRSKHQWLTFVAGMAMLAPMYAAAQSQTQIYVPHNTSTLHFDQLANPRALCPAGSDKPMVKKTRVMALPADVIEPQKTPEGWPDLQGNWSAGNYPGVAAGSVELGENQLDQAIQCQNRKDPKLENMLIDPMKGRIPYQPWAKAIQMSNLANEYAPQKRMDLHPEARCFPIGIPQTPLLQGSAIRYVPGAVVFLSNKGTRIVPIDGPPHLGPEVELFKGDSRGHWEGNTLVVETVNNREGTFFDGYGTWHSEAMRVIERFTLMSQDTMFYEVTIIDPTVFTQTWKMAQNYDRNKNVSTETTEPLCHETDFTADRTVRAGLRARAVGLAGYRVNVNLATGRAVDPADEKYFEESGQPLGFEYAPMIPEEALPKGFNYTYTPPASDSKAKDGSAPH